jgi:hypothetical protein
MNLREIISQLNDYDLDSEVESIQLSGREVTVAFENNVSLAPDYEQVCVWQAALIDGKIEEFEQFIKDEFNGVRIQYLEEIKTKPDIDTDGNSIPETGGRNDVFFAVHKDDVAKFAVPRLAAGIRWLEDVLDNERYRMERIGTPRYSIYPTRVTEYQCWPGRKGESNAEA